MVVEEDVGRVRMIVPATPDAFTATREQPGTGPLEDVTIDAFNDTTGPWPTLTLATQASMAIDESLGRAATSSKPSPVDHCTT